MPRGVGRKPASIAGLEKLLEVETELEPVAPAPPEGRRFRLPTWATFCEAAVLVAFSAFFISYGVVPLFGGDGLGLGEGQR